MTVPKLSSVLNMLCHTKKVGDENEDSNGDGNSRMKVNLRETWHEYTEWTDIEGVRHSFDRERPWMERYVDDCTTITSTRMLGHLRGRNAGYTT